MASTVRAVGAVAAGGALGSLARWALVEAFPTRPGGFAWGTFVVNVSGCLLIGVLMALVSSVWSGRPLLRLFLGVGVLGGYTTFSTYVLDFGRLIAEGILGAALAYLAGTLVAALAATFVGMAATGWLVGRRGARGEAAATPAAVGAVRSACLPTGVDGSA